MSDQKIDHAAEARKAASAGRATAVGKAMTPVESAALHYAHAQVHATLALAEQLRLANLFQTGAIGGGPMNNHTPGHVQAHLRHEWPDIAATLGIARSCAATQEGEGDD